MELDRISNLPSDVIVKILSCLTLKDAVRTSVFSSRWRDKWAMLSGLVFDEKCFSTENCASFVNIVYHVLLSHIVPIEKFVLSHTHLIPTKDIDRWVLHLSRNSLKVFELHIPYWPKYKMPICFFSYQDMIELKLFNCLLKSPTTFKGFRTLKRVIFQYVTLAQDVLENLIIPLLESLEVINCDGFTHLKIDAPNLRFLSFVGGLKDVSLQNTLNLAVVQFYLTELYDGQDLVSSSNLAKFFIDLPHIQWLKIDGFAVQYLAVGDLPGRLPKPCPELNFLSLLVYFNDLAEILTSLYLLRSSPVLEVLHVTVHHEEQVIAVDEEANSWLDNLDDDMNWSFPKLRLVQLTDFSGCKAEQDFIKFLLLNSPVLETMTIRAFSADGTSEVLKKLLQLRRTSSAEIIYLDP
ncbi:putative F-box domain, FBD domain, leucine-rich repeat domain, L domain-containing protein [Rosa chinensis]|uniref:Putative F-box domain, FBD domain, leucine-rich repeat domain, L domain-containing protein n=2 Tax=Rosa chinensis TaxID=74649 RepID=A0A2P6PK63_ROSCH|nr:F-box/FBD/LRR-repeat protein At1g13570 isoform X2 [Rosa chinensis]PRQ22310.1 putative F-box domain, FBD domain, leucine-rich repeat domain, L domain-containing protein [Rosa chinensis]